MAWGHAAAPVVGRTGVGGSGQRNMGFVPAVWSGRILKSIDDKLITGKLCTREYEGFIKGHGDSVRVHRIGNIKVAPYVIASGSTNWGRDTGGGAASKAFSDHSGQYNRMMAIDWQVLDGASTVITVNQADYFAFEVEDIEKAQADPQYVASATGRAGYALAAAAERYNLYTMLTAAKSATADDFGQVGGTSALTNDVLPIDCGTATNAYDYLVDLGVMMDDTLTPDTGRYIVAPSFFRAALLKDSRFVGAGADGSGKMRDQGYIGSVAGFDIYTLSRATFQSYDAGNTGTLVKNDTITDSTGDQAPDMFVSTASTGDDTYDGIAGVKEAYAFVDQVSKTENIRLQGAFADGVRGLHVYGGKALFPQWLFAVRFTDTTYAHSSTGNPES